MALNFVTAPEGKMFQHKEGCFAAAKMYLGSGDYIENYEIVDYRETADADPQELLDIITGGGQ